MFIGERPGVVVCLGVSSCSCQAGITLYTEVVPGFGVESNTISLSSVLPKPQNISPAVIVNSGPVSFSHVTEGGQQVGSEFPSVFDTRGGV